MIAAAIIHRVNLVPRPYVQNPVVSNCERLDRASEPGKGRVPDSLRLGRPISGEHVDFVRRSDVNGAVLPDTQRVSSAADVQRATKGSIPGEPTDLESDPRARVNGVIFPDCEGQHVISVRWRRHSPTKG